MRCPLCMSHDIITTKGLKYPYFCLCCQTAFNRADVAIKKRYGIAGYRTIVTPLWNKVKARVVRYRREKEARFIE